MSSHAVTSCSIDVQDTFGPVVDSHCLDGFDFTLLFEETILTILPLGITAFASSALAPVWGYGVYILLARADNTRTLTKGVAFASLSLFETLNQPLMFAINAAEDFRIVVNSFRRIQEYITSEEHEDYRLSPRRTSHVVILDFLNQMGMRYLSKNSQIHGQVLIDDAVLKNLNFELPKSQTTMIFGPVGTGKSSFLKLLLGEMPYISGSVSVIFLRAAYCPQSPWLLRGTIQKNIVGMSEWDSKWYETVVHACMLSALARALYSRNSFMILDDVLTGLDRTTEQSILDGVFGPDGLLKRLRSTVVLATNSSNHLQFASHIIVLNEAGHIERQGPPNSISVNELLKKDGFQPSAPTALPEPEIPVEILQQIDAVKCHEPETNRKTGDLKIYAYYAKIAGWWTILAYLLACAAFVFGVTFPSIWLQWWTDANSKHPNERIGYWLGVYAALAIITMIGCAVSDCVFNLIVVPKTSKKFHELLLDTTMRAPATFLTSTDTGTTVNRFSQDLELIDNDLPKSLDSTVFQFMSAIVSAILIFTGSGYVAAAIPLCIFCLGLIQYYYLRTSRQLRLLDIEAKAPLFSHFLETIHGVSCLRAYGWTERYTERSYEVLNTSQKPYYLMWCIQRWLALVLDLFVAGVAILLVALATNIHNGSTGFLGVALFNIVTFSSTLQTLVTEWMQVETAIGAINRIRSYVMNVKNENLPGEVNAVPPIGLRAERLHSRTSQLPGERIAICGRTGSGKSSLISVLLRLLEIDTGSIEIDNVDISTIPREELRKRLNTLPQEPFFLHGSVRENMDPLQGADDEFIIKALRARQLFCLARAVVKPGNILIMDEATSSTDADTEELMQRIIRDNFSGRTVISVVHKLHTILDYDHVLLLDKGRVMESGNPQALLATPASAFRKLYESLQ
ncbi:ABC transporter gloK [Cladobotryum mycophilum]|uniref:ABC transporter gloK n=1 Tax=Cladobotryum mycophilum TaxID=491253 RepID=A0ABR0S9F2_9HYPO